MRTQLFSQLAKILGWVTLELRAVGRRRIEFRLLQPARSCGEGFTEARDIAPHAPILRATTVQKRIDSLEIRTIRCGSERINNARSSPGVVDQSCMSQCREVP
jgi:hypothetical protein